VNLETNHNKTEQIKILETLNFMRDVDYDYLLIPSPSEFC